MFETIGYITVFLILSGLVILQYTLMCLELYKKDLNKIEHFIGWVPLLPFILTFITFLWFILTITYKHFNKWFEINLGWLFVNGRKREVWLEYLREKYNK